ncbi:hypothetical protein CPB83DRAFT_848341 [Crepidotus variabilis]|uniref:Ubiquitin carboxyl-terminal hydrolase n=1 Tax=Crepidotus variabilis TaxID=179855 RepID=A0A9P6JTT4_9AGAR|nr:hypothetical protein CPB83DRAFT_848341 [Crepidotus variabilis]
MKKSKWISFGVQPSPYRNGKAPSGPATSPAPIPIQSPADAKKFGLENFGNTCYANSVLQALYFCSPFRDLLLQDLEITIPPNVSPLIPAAALTKSPQPSAVRRKPERKASTAGELPTTSPQNTAIPIPTSPSSLFDALRSLFLHISTNPGDKGSVAPRAFIEKLKELNELFRSTMHQDAHEFLNYLLNQIVEEIEEEKKLPAPAANGEDLSSSIQSLASKPPATVVTTSNSSNSGAAPHDATLVHKLFEGVLTSETRCLTCETVSSRDESFLDLSIDIEQNSSVTACLRQFSASEMLCQKNKFFCDSCCDLQEAEKRMKIKKLPNVLALHLKRFKYQEDLGRYTKLTYRVAFPFELRLFNTVDDMDDADRLYNLFAIVVHIGNGPHHGHYISIIKVAGSWFLFDDDQVSSISETDISKYFGDSNAGSAYVLYYQAEDIDTAALGLRVPDILPPDTLTNATPALERSPIFQEAIPLPPGLSALPQSEAEIDPLQTNSPIRHPYSEKPALVGSPTVLSIPQAVESPRPPSAGATPTTPTSLTSKLFHTVRRAPSMTATRSSGADNENRRSLTDKSPRPSASIPSFVNSIDSATEAPPPVPPLPPNLVVNKPQLYQSVASSPILPTLGSEPESDVRDKNKEKEKDKKGSWFSRKRKSLKLGDKDRSSKYGTSSAPAVPSPRLITDDNEPGSSSGLFTRSTSSTGTPIMHRRPSESGSPADFSSLHPDSGRRGVNGHDGSHSPTSGTSSPSSTSLLTNGAGHPNGSTSTTQPSTSVSSTTSSTPPSFDHSPAKKSALLPSSSDRVRSSVDRKRSLDLKSIPYSGALMASSPLSTTPQPTWEAKHLPPLPLPPSRGSNYSPSHRSTSSNGYIQPGEYDTGSTLKGKARSVEPEFPQSHTPNGYFSPPSSFPLPIPEPPSLASSIGGNNSAGSSGISSASNTMKRATRKLSLTAPMLGFGKREKDKDKDKR